MIRSRNITTRAMAAAGCALVLGFAGHAGSSHAATTGVCIPTSSIDHTEIPDNSTILFHMKGGKVWKNSLNSPCFNLKFQGSFQYTTDYDEICANQQTIRVLQPGAGMRLGAACMLGEFSPYSPASKTMTGG